MRDWPVRRREPTELINVVLDDATVDRLRMAAEGREIELEQLIVGILHRASYHIDEFFPRAGDNASVGERTGPG